MADIEFSGRTLGLYIHIPFCLSKCSYCDFFSVASANKVPDDYVRALCGEISSRFSGSDCLVDSVYVGGGTPSLLSPAQIHTIFSCIRGNVPLKPGCEITFEVNPDDVCDSLLDALASCGVSRISCGIQSLCGDALTFCRRRASAEISRSALSLLKRRWHGNLSVDIICAMPHESSRSFLDGLAELVSLRPDHISMYCLTVEEETPLGSLIACGSLAYDYDLADEMWISGRDFLEDAGYNQYEISNFSLPGKECAHNIRYWSRGDYAGVGSGAAGTLYFPGGRALRRSNSRDIKQYTGYWNCGDAGKSGEIPWTTEKIDEKSGEFEFFMMSLRKSAGFSESEYECAFERRLPQDVRDVFLRWQKRGLARISAAGGDAVYSLGRDGILFLNAFLGELP